MLNIVRQSQIQGLMAIDSATARHLGPVERVWLDHSNRVVYVSGLSGYVPLAQVASIDQHALSTYGHVVVEVPEGLYHLDETMVCEAGGLPIGWVNDVLFDWHTGDVLAYILAGQIADSFGEPVVLVPDDVMALTTESLTLREGAQTRLKRQSEGLPHVLSEKSQQVQQLVRVIGDRLHHLIAPHDRPEVVHVKVREVSDEMAATGHHDHHTLQEATAYLHEQWDSLQQNIERSSHRAKAALDDAWHHLTGKH